MLQEEPQYFEAFKKSKLYIKLLAELNLLSDATAMTKTGDAGTDECTNGLTLCVLAAHLILEPVL